MTEITKHGVQMSNVVSKTNNISCISMIMLGLTLLGTPLAAQTEVVLDHHPVACIAPQLKIPAWTDARGWDNDAYQSTIALANVTADDDLELLGRDPLGVTVHVFEIDPDLGWWGAWMPKYSADYRESDLADPKWQSPDHYATIRYLDLDGNGIDEMVAYENGSKGRGLLAFSFVGGDAQSSGNWELINKKGFKLTKNTDWEYEAIASGFRVGKILAGNAEQLFVRSQQGIIGMRWNPAKSNFEVLADPAKKNYFKSWVDKSYYQTIQAADVDGDGIDEVIGRSAAGLVAVKYMPGIGWQQTTKPNEILNYKEAHSYRYYRTMVWGRFTDPDKDSLAVWTQAGVQLIELTSENTWSRRVLGAGLEPDKNDPTRMLQQMRAADINRDGLDELHFVYSYGGAIHSYSFNAKAKKWQVLNTGNTAKDEDLREPIFGLEFGDIDGDGIAEAVGRSSKGMVSYFYDSNEKRWEENFSCGFPAFSGRQAKAYAAMNKVRFNGSTEFRHRYNDKDNRANRDFVNGQHLRPDDDDISYDQRDWEAVRSQLLQEMDWAAATLSVFEGQREGFESQYTSQWESMATVGIELLQQVNEDEGIDIKAILVDLATAAVDMATDGIASKIFNKKSKELLIKALTKGASMLMGAGVEALADEVFPNKPLVENVDKLKNEIVDKKQDSQSHLNIWAREVTGLDAKAGDLGTMAAVALLHQRGYWPANFSTEAFIEDRARWSFKRWLYQQIITTVYEIHIYDCRPGICPPKTPSITRACYVKYPKPAHKVDSNTCRHGLWVYRAIEKKGDNWMPTLPDEVIEVLTGELSDECQKDGRYHVDRCNLGLEMDELLFNRGGWQFNVKNTSVLVGNDSKPKLKLSCGGLGATIIGSRDGGVIYGTPEVDVIYSYDGDDVIYAGGGNDIICSGGGEDLVYGGPGDDIIILGYGNDYAAGGDGDDQIYGGAGNDWLLGENGDDTLMGGLGNDQLEGGDGFDTIYGGSQGTNNDCSGEETYYCDTETN
ncbi:MAG: calcium-binding protein [Xanthomonadales bacterium]|nr:calcium-binding protein [Xanthomonadales bacterium]